MALLSEAIVALDLGEQATAVYDKLAPFTGRNVVLPTVAFLGAVELWLGILARVAGRDAVALEQLAAARARATRDGARPTLARIAVEEATVLLRDGSDAARRRAQELLDDAEACCEELNLVRIGEQVQALRADLAPVAPAAPAAAATEATEAAAREATLQRVGDVWLVEHRGEKMHLRDNRGVRLLAMLLERPGTAVHSLDLIAAIDGLGPGAAVQSSGGQETGGRYGVQGGTGPALDSTAKGEYRAKIAELEEQLARAQARRDSEAIERIGKELEFLIGELSRATGLGGRDRESGSHAERARINVTRAIRMALRKIASYDPRLGAELMRDVRTGAFCVYAPDPLRPLSWTVRT
jgi:hypothetical protein